MRVLLCVVFVLVIHVSANEKKQIDRLLKDGVGMAMQFCNKKCNCSVVQKTITCNTMRNMWALANKGGRYVDEFAGFMVDVSDNNRRSIDNTSFTLESERSNGLAKIKGLTLKKFKKLNRIQADFFEKYFPVLEYLTVTESDNHLKELTIGWLPELRVLQLKGMDMRKVTGCGEVHRYCFREDRMDLFQIPTLNMRRMGLPDFITEVKIDHNNVSTGIGDEDVFRNKRVTTLRYVISRVMPFPSILYDVEVMEEFYFEIEHLYDELQLWALMVTLQEQPSLVSRLNLKLKTNEDMDMKFPVIMKSCEGCDFNTIAHIAEFDGVCEEEQNYLDTFNIDLPSGFQKNKYLTIRGIYVNVETLLETLDGDSTFHVTVYAFIAKVPKTKFVNFDLKVYYGVLENNVAELSQVIKLRNPYTLIRYEDAFGAPIHYAKKVDALFVHAYSLCIAKLTAKFVTDSPDTKFKESVAWKMFSNLPSIAIYSSCGEVLTNSRISAIQGLLNKHTYIFLDREKAINRLPYLYREAQESLAEVLIDSAEMILKKKADFQMRKSPSEVLTMNLIQLKNTLDEGDEKQIEFLGNEKAKVLELANIAWRRKIVQQAQLGNLQQILDEELLIYADLELDLKDKVKTFIAGATNRDADQWADVVNQLTDSVISSINMSRYACDERISKKAARTEKLYQTLRDITAMTKDIRQTMKEMEAISFTYSNVREIFKSKYRLLKQTVSEMSVDGNVQQERERKEGLLKRISRGLVHIEDITESVAILYQSKTAEITYKYESEVGSLATEGLSIVKRQYNINTNDIMKWDVIRNKVKSLINEEILLGVPESGDYLSALFNIMMKAKTLAQLRLDQSNLMSDIILADKSYWEFIEEAAALTKAAGDIKKAINTRSQDTSMDKLKDEYKGHYMKTEKYIYYATFINKLRIIEAQNEFCQGYYYYFLHKCPDEYNIDIFTPLDEVITKYGALVLDTSVHKPQYFETPPQAFNDIVITVKKEENCKCVSTPYDGLKGIQKNRNITDKEKSKFKTSSKLACFPHRRPHAQVSDVLEKLVRCNMGQIDTLVQYNSISIEVPVNYKDDFTNYERVRIDDVKVNIQGVKTANGKVVATVTNTGITQDRYHGDVYNFYGNPRIRRYEYCGENVRKESEREEDNSGGELPSECQHKNHKTIVSTYTHSDFKGSEVKPTLFSTWIVRVPDEENKGLDLSQVTAVEISFSGSLLSGHTDYSNYYMTEELVPKDNAETSSDSRPVVLRKETLRAYTESEIPYDEEKDLSLIE